MPGHVYPVPLVLDLAGDLRLGSAAVVCLNRGKGHDGD